MWTEVKNLYFQIQFCVIRTGNFYSFLTHLGWDKMDAIFQTTFSNGFELKNVWILIKISLKFVPKGPINNIPALVQIMAWRQPGAKPLSESMMSSLLTHICVTRPQLVKCGTLVDLNKMADTWQTTSCNLQFKKHFLAKSWIKFHWNNSGQ